MYTLLIWWKESTKCWNCNSMSLCVCVCVIKKTHLLRLLKLSSNPMFSNSIVWTRTHTKSVLINFPQQFYDIILLVEKYSFHTHLSWSPCVLFFNDLSIRFVYVKIRLCGVSLGAKHANPISYPSTNRTYKYWEAFLHAQYRHFLLFIASECVCVWIHSLITQTV